MAKCGRKKLPSNEKRKHQVKCSFTSAEMVQLGNGKPENMSWGEWLRLKALARKLPRAIPEINQQAWVSLGKGLGNLNQLVKHLNQGEWYLIGDLTEPQALNIINSLKADIQSLRLELLGEKK